MIKKLALTAAVAASSVHTQATVYDVTSEITAGGMFLGTANLLDGSATAFNGPSGGTFAFGGSVTDSDDDGIVDTSDVTFSGTALFNSGPDVSLVFDLKGGIQVAGGTLFTSGTIAISTDTGSGFSPYATVDASVTNIPFLGTTAGGHLGQPTAGLDLSTVDFGLVKTVDLPGLWNGNIFDPSIAGGLSSITLFNNPATMYFEGTVTRAPVPIPAAAWLFGASLLGLAGAARRRRAMRAAVR